MTKKRTGLDALGLDSGVTAEQSQEKSSDRKKPFVAKIEPDKESIKVKKTSFYIPQKAFDQLRELAFSENKKMHDYFLEGLDRVFKHRGLKSLDDLT